MKKWHFAVIVGVILAMSVGFSAMNTEMSISGEAMVRAPGEIRIVDVVPTNMNNSIVLYKEQYTRDTVKVSSRMLGATGATMTGYDVHVKNSSEKRYYLKSIKANIDTCADILWKNYEGSALQVGGIVEPNTETSLHLVQFWTYEIYTGAQAPTCYEDILEVELEWVEYELTAPVIQIDTSEWKNRPTVSVATAGRASAGVNVYEYIETTTNEKPADDATATGRTSGALATSITEGEHYIWYRTVDKNDDRSDWSNAVLARVDVTPPTGSGALWGYTYVMDWTLSCGSGISIQNGGRKLVLTTSMTAGCEVSSGFIGVPPNERWYVGFYAKPGALTPAISGDSFWNGTVGGFHTGFGYFDLDGNRVTANNGYQANGYANGSAVGQTKWYEWNAGAALGVYLAQIYFITNTAYSRPPYEVWDIIMFSQGQAGCDRFLNMNSNDNLSGVAEIKWSKGTSALDVSYFRNGGGSAVTAPTRFMGGSDMADAQNKVITVYVKDRAGNDMVFVPSGSNLNTCMT